MPAEIRSLWMYYTLCHSRKPDDGTHKKKEQRAKVNNRELYYISSFNWSQCFVSALAVGVSRVSSLWSREKTHSNEYVFGLAVYDLQMVAFKMIPN